MEKVKTCLTYIPDTNWSRVKLLTLSCLPIAERSSRLWRFRLKVSPKSCYKQVQTFLNFEGSKSQLTHVRLIESFNHQTKLKSKVCLSSSIVSQRESSQIFEKNVFFENSFLPSFSIKRWPERNYSECINQRHKCSVLFHRPRNYSKST